MRAVMPGPDHIQKVLKIRKKTTRTRHTGHPSAVPVVEGDVEGGGGGDLANRPVDGRTSPWANRTSVFKAAAGRTTAAVHVQKPILGAVSSQQVTAVVSS